jgi:hypothetical protein
MKSLPILQTRAALASSRLVNCKGCTACCEQGGLVYVRDEEVEPLEKIGVPIISVGGVAFIQRLPDGSCPMLDRAAKQCSIYEQRPLCCRLFPLDVLTIDGKLNWALSTHCPDDRKRLEAPQQTGSFVGSGSIGRIASTLETCIDKHDVAYFERKERVSARVEVLEDDQNGWVSVGQFLDTNPQSPEA